MPNRYGPSGLDRPHNLKVDGFYQFDFKKAGLVVLGASLRAQSGIPSNTLAAHPIYGPDTHVSYGYQLNKTTRLEGYVEIFNLFDQQPEVSVDETYTTNSSQPIVGGDAGDLPHAKTTVDRRQTANVVRKNLNYGKPTARPGAVDRSARLPPDVLAAGHELSVRAVAAVARSRHRAPRSRGGTRSGFP